MKPKNKLKAFFSTKPMPCDYLPDRTEAKTAVDLTGDDAQQWANALSRAGFRRSHTVCYISSCPACQACVSARIVIDRFTPDKKMNKTLRQNKDVSLSLMPNIATEEHYALFKKYLSVRHTGGSMESMFFEEYRAMIEDAPVESCLLEFRTPDKLFGVMLVDVLDDGLSAVYSFYDTDFAQTSPGTLMILELIRYAKLISKPYVYLGYVIKGLSNMAYKNKFQPLEYCVNGEWKASLPD